MLMYSNNKIFTAHYYFFLWNRREFLDLQNEKIRCYNEVKFFLSNFPALSGSLVFLNNNNPKTWLTKCRYKYKIADFSL